METGPSNTPPRAMPAAGAASAEPDRNAPARVRGRTIIDDEVISVIARIAAEQIPGVHQLGESSLRSIMSRFGRHRGVDSEVGLEEAAVDVEIVVEFGYPIRELAEAMRERIIDTVETMTGRHVVEVNIFVVDVYIPKVERRQRRKLE